MSGNLVFLGWDVKSSGTLVNESHEAILWFRNNDDDKEGFVAEDPSLLVALVEALNKARVSLVQAEPIVLSQECKSFVSKLRRTDDYVGVVIANWRGKTVDERHIRDSYFLAAMAAVFGVSKSLGVEVVTEEVDVVA